MMSLKQAKWLLVGGAVAFLWHRSRESARRARGAQDERDDLDAMAIADAEVAIDLAHLDAELDAVNELDLDVDVDGIAVEAGGELYGHTPRAVAHLQDEDRAMDAGQNWLEALETAAAEDGSAPEAALNLDDAEDDEDESARQARMVADRPIADLGSAGPRGL